MSAESVFMKNPLPQVTADEKEEFKPSIWLRGEVQRLSISDLWSFQDWLVQETVEEYRRNRWHSRRTHRHGVVVRLLKCGKFMLVEGNHRVNAALLNRQKTINAFVTFDIRLLSKRQRLSFLKRANNRPQF